VTGRGWRTKGQYSEILIGKVNTILERSACRLTIREVYAAVVRSGDYAGAYNTFRSKHFAKGLKRGFIRANCVRDGRRGHTGRHRKFKVGDRVKIKVDNGQTPKWLVEQLRLSAPRTVVKVTPTGTFAHYFLGLNGKGNDDLGWRFFLSYELEPYSKNNVAGRPRVKRRYKRVSQPKASVDTSSALCGAVGGCGEASKHYEPNW
jgi:hypothetical protein